MFSVCAERLSPVPAARLRTADLWPAGVILLPHLFVFIKKVYGDAAHIYKHLCTRVALYIASLIDRTCLMTGRYCSDIYEQLTNRPAPSPFLPDPPPPPPRLPPLS